MKLVNLVPLKEIDFRNQDQFDDYVKNHELRPDTKVTIAGKVTTAGQAAKNSEPVKGTSVFGKDKGGSVFGNKVGASSKKTPPPKESTNWSFGALSGNAAWVAANTKLNLDLSYSERDDFVGTWADENLIDLNKVADAISNKKLKFTDIATALNGNPENKYTKDIASKYPLEPKDFEKYPKKSQEPTNDIDGLTSHKDLDKYFKANKDKLDKKYIDDIEGEIGALKYLESDYKRGDADWEEVLVAYEDLQDLIKKAMNKGDNSTSKSKPFDADADTEDFANALPKGFSEYFGGTIDGVTSFGDDNGNNVFVSDPSVYDDKGNYAVSGYNDDDMTNTNYKSFKDKQQAIEYAKQLAIKLSGSTKLSEMIPKKIKK